jgi:non-ribosomal peptide synthetase component E (peptide arylation enzyme)
VVSTWYQEVPKELAEGYVTLGQWYDESLQQLASSQASEPAQAAEELLAQYWEEFQR